MGKEINLHNKKKLIDLLFSEAKGKIFALNGFYCYDLNILTEIIVKSYINACYEYFIEQAVTDFDELYKAILSVSNDGYYFNKKSICTGFDHEEMMVSNVMEYRSLVEYYLDTESLTNGHPYLDFTLDPIDEENAQEVLKVLNSEKKISILFKDKAMLGGNAKKQIFWITPADAIAELRRRCIDEDLADKVRNSLGLIHYRENSYLVELVFKGNNINGLSYYPTFIEGCDHPRFKAIKNHASSYPDWGRTANLELVTRTATNIDGVPEQVVKPINLDILDVDVRPIGFTCNAMGVSENDNDEVFLECLIRYAAITHKKNVSISDVQKFYQKLL